MEELRSLLPGQWMDTFWLGLQILLILVAAFLLQRIVARGLSRLGQRYPLPPELLVPVRGGLRWLIMGSALLFVLERLGVSATVLWTALSGFVAVAAVVDRATGAGEVIAEAGVEYRYLLGLEDLGLA